MSRDTPGHPGNTMDSSRRCRCWSSAVGPPRRHPPPKKKIKLKKSELRMQTKASPWYLHGVKLEIFIMHQMGIGAPASALSEAMVKMKR